MSAGQIPADDPVQRAVREVVLALVERGEPFNPAEVALAVRSPVASVAAALSALHADGVLAPLGYRRTLAKRRTRSGVVTTVEYVPARSSERPSTAPTRTPALRPLGYLGVAAGDARRLANQQVALQAQLQSNAKDLIRTGEILIAIRGLAGPAGFEPFLRRQMRMSIDTARRIIRVTETFRDHAAVDRLATASTSVLYKLAEASFPIDLREAILAKGGLEVGGTVVPLGRLTIRDLRAAKRAAVARTARLAAISRALAPLDPDDPSAVALRIERDGIVGVPLTTLGGDLPPAAHRRAVDALIASADRLAARAESGALEAAEVALGAAALKAALARLEGTTSQAPSAADRVGSRAMIVAIDGPAGAGKSTIARAVAERLGFVLVDTGAIYRAVALVSRRRRVEAEAELAGLLDGLQIELDGSIVRLDGADVSAAIRTPEISMHASVVSAMPAVRAGLLDLQRRIARQHPKGAVLEGRDIGTVVFPDAPVKIFLTASLQERAGRRALELANRGAPQPLEDVLQEVRLRDERDSQRAVAPLKPAEDAVLVDTTGRSIESIVEEIVAVASKHAPSS